MAKMTPEEKELAKQKRDEYEIEQGEKYPFAHLDGEKVHLVLSSDSPFSIEVRFTDGADEDFIGLLNVRFLGYFIRALVARYNVLVKEANEEAGNSAMLRLNKIPLTVVPVRREVEEWLC